MAATKYGDLVRTLNYIKGMGGANARQMTFMAGDQLQGFNLNFVVGVYDEPGDWAPGMGAHTHPFDEALLFFGYDDNDLSYLGAEMELAMGKEYEAHRFNVPTVVAAPANLPHCPLITRKVYKPFGHFHLALSGRYAAEKIEQEGTTDGKKYAYLFNTLKVKKATGGADAAQLLSADGKDLAGLPLNFNLGRYKQTGAWHPGKGSCRHSYDSCLVFFGHKTDNLSYLGAEISIEIGIEGEKYTFDVPTVVVLPRGTPYGSITCRKLEKPYSVMQIGLSARYDCEWL
ncbi:MAG: hypothetical protein JXA17_06485 [Dehalococcoidales bacterium]|nr:hypothetical protein [Dehalococcoidales bacterium]